MPPPFLTGSRVVSTHTPPGHLLRGFAVGATLLAASALLPPAARAAEGPECLSPNPADWPAPAKPYFMIAFDTSGSMTTQVPPLPAAGVNPSCGAAYGATRIGHGRCAIKNTIDAYAGQANFGLATYATRLSNCPAGACQQPPAPATQWVGCTVSLLPGDTVGVSCNGGCGPEPPPVAAFSATRAGGNIVVPMLADLSPPPPSNVPDLLAWVDNDCSDSRELYSGGCTPLNGILRDMFRYYSSEWVFPSIVVPNPNIPVASPLTSVALGEKACRSVNVILVTDGDDTCDVNPADAVDAAKKLFAGFNKDGIAWKVRTYVINFSGGTKANTDQIARAGTGDLTPATTDAGDPAGVTSSFQAENEVDIALALSKIIGGSIQTETCDNKDNNCNGCTDEGFSHYCNNQLAPQAAKCCVWASAAQRTACLTTYNGTITPANPQGNLTKLPCTTPAQFADPTTWLCFDPKETCDGVDNNCNGVTDEGTLTCGVPAHCPQAEICNGQDDNCNGTVDEGCPICLVVPSAETCDGCDNDCDGIADNGVAAVACGLTGPNEPPNCAGVQTCKAQQAVNPPGACKAGGGPFFNACTAVAQAETCDGLDNNCNGIVDDGVAPLPCIPAGTPGNLVYFGDNGNATSQCHRGSQSCTSGAFGVCVGFVGPTPEICDGIDNDCDGVVDDSPIGVGQMCGINQLPCTPGTTACVNGALVCNGGTAPKPETCNGKDDNCNGLIDDPPLADAPAAGQNGCWDLPGNCCQFPPAPAPAKLVWCPPAGGACGGPGSLTVPCHAGTLSCTGVNGWICVGPSGPSPETCDGLDNDCNGAPDDGNLPLVGAVCGSDVGECQSGTLVCNVGVLSCMGAVTPVQETCDDKDNDCDGTIDNNVAPMGPCIEPYDMVAFPGDRSSAPCKPGVLLCDGQGNFKCQGGVAPHAEVCDGQDNDCDGQKDEIGVAPDGISGTADPNDVTHVLGQPCGGMGECVGGAWECLNGVVGCGGGQTPVPEICDCQDNDCDGAIDNQNAPGLPLICGSSSKECVKSADACFCSPKCDLGEEFPCPPGQTCKAVTSSQTGQSLGTYCIPDACNDCPHQTIKDGNDKVVCAPADTKPDADCTQPPVCVCRGQTGCNTPCSGKAPCPAGRICTDYGPKAGECVPNNCYNLPCNGCGMACNGGGCVPNPCTAVTCPLTQVCKPTEDFLSHVCVDSCAGVMCLSGKACVDGACVDTCSPACPMGQVCDLTLVPPTCVGNKCEPDPCTDGSFCNPATGQCSNYPCSGVLCPAGQICDDGTGQCMPINPTGTGGGGAGGSMTTSTTGATTSTSTTTSSGGGEGGTRGVFGLATGGGGCSCEVGPRGSTLGDARWALVALALALGRYRRRTRRAPRPL